MEVFSKLKMKKLKSLFFFKVFTTSALDKWYFNPTLDLCLHTVSVILKQSFECGRIVKQKVAGDGALEIL